MTFRESDLTDLLSIMQIWRFYKRYFSFTWPWPAKNSFQIIKDHQVVQQNKEFQRKCKKIGASILIIEILSTCK